MEDFCKQPCGGSGQKRQYRYCDSPAPKYDGNECPGDSEIFHPCNRGRVCKEGNINLYNLLYNMKSIN